MLVDNMATKPIGERMEIIDVKDFLESKCLESCD